MAKNQSLIEPLFTVAAILGIIQGITWFGLAVAAIIVYESNSTDFCKLGEPVVGCYIYGLYLVKDTTTDDSSPIIIQPKQFIIFAYIYLILSFCWLIHSSVMLWTILKKKNIAHSKYKIGLWSVITTTVSLVDFILVCLLGRDYQKYTDLANNNNTQVISTSIIIIVVGIVMAIAARGFILWILNVILAIVLGKHAYSLHKKESLPNHSPINAYLNGSRPPWEMPDFPQPNDTNGEYNKNFRNDDMFVPYSSNNQQINNNESLRRAQPFSSPSNPSWKPKENQNNFDNRPFGFSGNRPTNPTNFPPNNSRLWDVNPRRTPQGYQEQRRPPFNNNSPNIPDPDYSPPSRVKGVLRPRSNYEL